MTRRTFSIALVFLGLFVFGAEVRAENRADGATRFASVVRPMKLFDGFD